MSARRRGGRLGPRGAREAGAVLIWTALLMTVLLALTGWAVDFSHWNQERTRMQKAADAAALAGAVFMPENAGGIAFSTARDIAAKNGYQDGKDGVTIDVAQGQLPNQLKVTIHKTVKNTFAVVVGIGSTAIGKRSVAEYQRAVSMGSPINQFGNDPELSAPVHGSTRYPDFWTNVFGPSSQKSKGDAIQSTICGGADNCGSTNTDYDPNGYFYAIEVASTASPLVVSAFDPEFAHVGDNCGDNDNNSNLVGAANLPANFNPQYPGSIPPSVRYSSSALSVYCTGDMYYTEGNGVVPWTVYRVRAPDLTPGTPTDNPVLCSVEFPGYLGNLAAALTNNTPQAGAPAAFVKYFRQWYTLCTVNNPQVGTYFLQIETSTKINGTAAPFGGGANRLALRATLGGGSSNLQIHGDGRIGIYANSPAANTTFYLARVLPGAPGRALVMSFFDVGDAAQPGAITVLPPTDSNVGSRFSGCTYVPPPSNSTGPPWGTFTPTASGCTITNVSSATYNGQWIQMKIPIPDNYTCNYNDPLGCWTRVNFAFPDRVSDTTTWSAQMTGDPVRIVQ
ncbi:MAG: pilus assembly protein TadG-related protein [Acidimicrobiia bacterium]